MSGCVYIARNPSFPHLIKIGKTRDLKKRIASLSASSSVPDNFECIYSVEVPNYALLEKKTHDHFAKERVSQNKEFFNSNPDRVKEFLEGECNKNDYSKIQTYQIDPTRMAVINFRSLSPIISRNELMRITGKNNEMLKISVNNWVKSGILKKAGPRSGIYYNLVNDPDWKNHIAEAVLKKYPSAILAGPTVLHAFGCQTQIPSKMWVIILKARTKVEMDGVEFMPRPLKWYAQNKPEQQLFGLPSLSPKQALEDAFKHQGLHGSWVPDMDDIDMDDVNEASETPLPPPRKKVF